MNSDPKIKVEKLSDDVHKLVFPDQKELYLIGTAHVSAESVKVVEKTILETEPDTVAVELDEQRLEVMKNKKKFEETDIIQIIKKKKVLFFIAQLMMSSYQKKIAEAHGITPGAEFKKAIEMADEREIKIILADRNVGVTLKRLTRKMSMWTKTKLLVSMFIADTDGKEIDEEEIKKLKNQDNLTALIGEMGETMPVIKQVMLDERNIFLASKIRQNMGEKTVAVVGAAHVPGILECFEKKQETEDFAALEHIPPKSKVTKFLPWLFPVIIISMFIYGFYNGNTEQIGQSAFYWILINGTLTAIGCILALGHPLTIPVGFIAAPITSLNPTIGAGMVVGLLQIFLVRPKVKDFEKVSNDIAHFKGWWQNRLTRALLVSFFASVGSSIGTFVAFPFILKLVS